MPSLSVPNSRISFSKIWLLPANWRALYLGKNHQLRKQQYTLIKTRSNYFLTTLSKRARWRQQNLVVTIAYYILLNVYPLTLKLSIFPNISHGKFSKILFFIVFIIFYILYLYYFAFYIYRYFRNNGSSLKSSKLSDLLSGFISLCQSLIQFKLYMLAPANINLPNVNHRNTTKSCKICSKVQTQQ